MDRKILKKDTRREGGCPWHGNRKVLEGFMGLKNRYTMVVIDGKGFQTDTSKDQTSTPWGPEEKAVPATLHLLSLLCENSRIGG